VRKDYLKQYGSWAVVTGASNGIGKEIAIYLAELGFHLALVARSQDKLEALASDLATRHGTKTLLLPYDLGQQDAITEIMQRTQALDVGLLVAAAGFGSSGALLRNNIRDELNMVKVNCEVPLEMSYYFADKFVKQKRGGIILFSSLMGFQGAPNAANYAATKGYIQGLGEGLYVELKPHGVDVLIAAPGPVRTGFAEVADMQMSLAAKPREVARATVNALGKTMTVRPGVVAKFLGWSLIPATRRMRVSIMKIIMDGMMKHA
jgi:short-subunit dehydrogenase